MELNLAAICEAIEPIAGDRDCIVYRDRRLSWREVGDRTRRLANVLVEAGLGVRGEFSRTAGWESPQDHVALYLYNGNEYLESMLGSYKARCAPVNVNYRYRAGELRYILQDSAAREIVYHGSFAPLLDEIRDELPELRLLLQVDDGSGYPLLRGARDYEAALAAAEATLAAAVVESWSGDDLYICYTGGTTGLPKGVLWRQADFLVAALGVRRRDGSDHESMAELVDAAEECHLRALPAPPFMHGAAHWNAMSAWVAGGTVLVQDDPTHLDPGDIWRTVDRERATSLLVVGDPFVRPLLENWDAAEAAGHPYDGSSLRFLLSGGAVLSAESKTALLRRLPELTIVDVLGSTESGRQGIARVGGDDDARAGFRPSASAAVLTEDRSRRVSAGDPQIGWLAQSGRVPLGYLGDPLKTRQTFPLIDGSRYAVAGDRARLGADGRIELLGRDSATINTGGEKVFAEEVETVIKTHPAVADAVVCGRPSPRWGQEVVAIVSTRPGHQADDEEIRAWCRSRLAGFKTPRTILRRAVIERSPSGKADYRWAASVAASEE